MSKSFQSERENLIHELALYKRTAEVDQRRAVDRLLDIELNFWMESAQFCLAELEIWDEVGDHAKCEEAIGRARECLEHLYILLD